MEGKCESSGRSPGELALKWLNEKVDASMLTANSIKRETLPMDNR
jgi:hypothetical protein